MLGLALALCWPDAGVFAQEAANRDAALEQREQRERIEQWRREQERRALQTGAPVETRWLPPLPAEKPCFVIQRVRIEAAAEAAPSEAQAHQRLPLTPLLGPVASTPGYEGVCLGADSLTRLRDNLQARLQARGYLTSALTIAAQDLRSGELVLTLEPGLVEAVAVEGARPEARMGANALALHPGEPLNLRDIEQTLENLARLPSQSARFVIEPGTQASGSIVRILPLQPEARLWRVSAGAERADGTDYGDVQLTAQLGLDHALGLSDQLGLWAAHSQGKAAGPDGGARPLQTSWYAYWSLPWGRHALSFSLSRADYRRTIAAGVGRFRDAGRDMTSRLRWESTLWRGEQARLQGWLAVSQRRARTWLDDIELISRRRLGTSVEQGVSLWWRQASCDLTLETEGARVQRLERDSDFQAPTDGLPRSWRGEFQWACTLAAGLDVRGQAWMQRAAQPVDGTDLLVLGSPQTVRAHASADALTGYGMAVLRQELLLPPLRWADGWAARPGVALDWGRVHNPLDGGRAGRELSAWALSLRWQAGTASGLLAVQQAWKPPPGAPEAVAQSRRHARWQAQVQLSL